LIDAAKSLGGISDRPIIYIPPNTKYDFNMLMDSPDVPDTVIFFDLSSLGGYSSGSYQQGVIGFFDKGSSASDIDTNFVISSGHNPSLRLENTGKSGSPSAIGRSALLNWGQGVLTKAVQ
jgi:hypothetical protein